MSEKSDEVKDDIKICCFLWNAGREDHTDSMWVLHICIEPIMHHGRHKCSCGKKSKPQAMEKENDNG